nr:TRAP transporter small permease subunit [uncultured Sphaerochaeta sp.]
MKPLIKIFDSIDSTMAFIEKHVSSLLFTALFIVFIINVVFRYFFKAILWGHELSLLLFLWITIFGCCYANRTDENVKFDSVYLGGSEKRKCVFDIIGSVLVVSTFSISFFPSLDYIIFMNYEISDSLPLRKGMIFSVYLYFLISMIYQYSRKLIVSINRLVSISQRTV